MMNKNERVVILWTKNPNDHNTRLYSDNKLYIFINYIRYNHGLDEFFYPVPFFILNILILFCKCKCNERWANPYLHS